jgi:predicted site-specific integrase-resolvase
MPYVPLRKAVEFLGLHPHTLRKYADEGKIESIKNEAGQRLYNVESYQRHATRATTVCYCRVSSSKQRDDLLRQIAFMQELYPDAEIIQDIGSGLNFKRKGLQSLLVRFMRGDKLTVVVACRDRLCRFGLELFEFMAEQNGGKILVLDKSVHCPETERESRSSCHPSRLLLQNAGI